MRDISNPPAIQVAVTQLVCTSCGKETTAACDCNVIYRPKAAMRAADYAEQNPAASVREIEEEADVGHGTAQRAKATCTSGTPDTVTIGRDGKSYPAQKQASLGDRRPMVLWSTLYAFQDQFLTMDPAKLLAGMDDDMRGGVRELVPRITAWLQRMVKAASQ